MTGRPKKRALTPLQGRILRKFEEAGADDLCQVLWLRDPAVADAAAFAADLRAALLGLLHLGLVTLEGLPGRTDEASCIAGISGGDFHAPRAHGITLVLNPDGRRALAE